MKSLSYFGPVAAILEAETEITFSKVLKTKYTLKKQKKKNTWIHKVPEFYSENFVMRVRKLCYIFLIWKWTFRKNYFTKMNM